MNFHHIETLFDFFVDLRNTCFCNIEQVSKNSTTNELCHYLGHTVKSLIVKTNKNVNALM